MEQLSDFFNNLFSTEGFPPRWGCGSWSPFHGWLYIVADIGIWGAYFAIPLLIGNLITRRKDLPFPRIFWLFAVFIFACGSTHLMDALMFWWPAYRVSALVFLWTAVVSWVTVFALMPVLPVALSLRSPADLENEVNERKLAEEALREQTLQLEAINRELEAFTYSVSHDLRAPLRSLDGFSQALLEDYGNQLDDEGKDYLHRIRNNSQRMAKLIDDLLNLSRVTRSEMRKTQVDLSSMAEEILGELREQSPGRSVETIIQSGLSDTADMELMRAVLTNLLDNAWKFTSHTDAPRIEFGQMATPEGETLYFVRDNGAGFDMAYKDKLFGAFQRLHGTQEFSGTGVGLATVQRVLQRHGGRIWAEAAPNQGATFYFTLGKGDESDDTA